MPTSLITGGAGFIGSHLAALLKARGDRVIIVDDLSTGRRQNIAGLLDERCRFIEGRCGEVLRDHADLLSGVTQVYHLAAAVGVQLLAERPHRVIRNNVEETAALLDAIAGARGEARVAVLVASSSEVYGKNATFPMSEGQDLAYGPTTAPRWAYAMSKALDEHLGLAHHAAGDVSAVVVRLFNTIGPRQVGSYGMVVPRFVRAAVRGEDLTIFGDGRQTRCFCDARDVTAACAALLADARHHGQVYNVGSDREINIADLADRVIALAGSRSRKKFIPFEAAYAPGFEDFARRVPSLAKVRAAIGFEPRYSLDDTLRELIELERTAAGSAQG